MIFMLTTKPYIIMWPLVFPESLLHNLVLSLQDVYIHTRDLWRQPVQIELLALYILIKAACGI